MPETEYIHNDKSINAFSLGKGEILSEFFEISDKAHEGGMGDVFFCRDKRDNKFYVLKTFKNIGLSEQFREEVLFSLSIPKHPYVVYTRTVISEEDRYYLVMDFIGKQPYSFEEKVRGNTLSVVIREHSLEEKQALIWAIQICQGMEFLNSCGLKAHKDLKPDNILISPNNDIKIADFGLVSSKKQGGTIGYQAPECSRNKQADVRSDIYSFGIMFYQMLNHGEFPFENNGNPFYDINKTKIKQSHYSDILSKCLADKPSNRYKDFEQLKEKLTKCLHKYYPEYQLPKIQDIKGHVWTSGQHELLFLGSLLLYSNKLQADELLLKGLGFYLLQKYLAGFIYLSKALDKNKNLKEVYSYRYKCRVGHISNPFHLSIARWLVYITCFLISSIVNNFIGTIIYYSTGWLILTPVLNIIIPIILIYYFSSYWDYEKYKNRKIQILYYLIPFGQLIPLLFNRQAFFEISNYIVEWIYIGIFLLAVGGFFAWIVRKSIKKGNNLGRLRVIWIYSKIIGVLWINGIRYGWQFLFNHDKDIMLKDDKGKKAWDILHNRSSYSLKEYVKACLQLYKNPSKYPYDVILYHNIFLCRLEGNTKRLLKLCEKMEEKFDYRSHSLYLALFEKALAYKEQQSADSELQVWHKIVSSYEKLCQNHHPKEDFIRNANYEYPTGEWTKSFITTLIALVAYFQTKEKLEKYYFVLASSYFLLFQNKWALMFYEHLLVETKHIDFNELDKNTTDVLTEFNKHFFEESKQLYLSVEELKWQANRLYQHLGVCQYEMKQYTQAFDSFSKAIQCNPFDRKLYAWRKIVARGNLFYQGWMKDLYYYMLCRLDYGITFKKEMRRQIYF